MPGGPKRALIDAFRRAPHALAPAEERSFAEGASRDATRGPAALVR
jgi:hypothetical protein